MSPQDAQKEIASNLATYVKGGSEAPTAKERIINIMAAQCKSATMTPLSDSMTPRRN